MTIHSGKYVAQPFVASSDKAEISGEVLQAILQNARADETHAFLKKANLPSIDPDKWYPQQVVLNFYAAIKSSDINSAENLVAIGMKFTDTMPFPPEAKTIEDAVISLGEGLKSVVRNTPDEENFFVTDHRSGYCRIVANLPYPSDLLYGYLWGIAKRFRPASVPFAVRVVDNPTPDENPGLVYDITWG